MLHNIYCTYIDLQLINKKKKEILQFEEQFTGAQILEFVPFFAS